MHRKITPTEGVEGVRVVEGLVPVVEGGWSKGSNPNVCGWCMLEGRLIVVRLLWSNRPIGVESGSRARGAGVAQEYTNRRWLMGSIRL
jgi:hypothetical protein